VASGDYPLARPLFVYSSDVIFREKPQVAAFLGYYLQNAAAQVGEVGYFPADAEITAANMETWQRAAGLTATTADNLTGVGGDISITGSSTVAPISQHVAELARGAGYSGEIAVESVGTDAGFKRFCLDGDADIADASRAMNTLDISVCEAHNRNPLEFQIGNDGLSVAVSQRRTPSSRISRENNSRPFSPKRRPGTRSTRPGRRRRSSASFPARTAARSTSSWGRCSTRTSRRSRPRR
jgi:ABC-type phosphate transport system substrate-binding protein